MSIRLRSVTRIRGGVCETISHRLFLEIISWHYPLGTSEKWRISLTIAKISTVKFYRGCNISKKRSGIWPSYALRIFHTATRSSTTILYTFVSSCLGRIVLLRNTSGYQNSYEFFCSFSNGWKASRGSLKARLWRKYRDRRKYSVRSSGGSLSRVLKGYIFRRNVSMV